MEDFEIKAINMADSPSRIWRRYVDATFVGQKTSQRDKYLEHINSVDPCLKFTVEYTRKDGSMHFLDTSVLPEPVKPLTTTVHKKPTHTDPVVAVGQPSQLDCKVKYHQHPDI